MVGGGEVSALWFFLLLSFLREKDFSGIAYWWLIFVDQNWLVGKHLILVACTIKSASSDVSGDGQSWFLAVGSGAGLSQFCSFPFQTCFFGTEAKV